MGHLPDLIRDLAIILMAGAIITLLFRRIKQPLVLGYIIAGFLVGPHFPLTPTVTDTANVETLAEIGVIFLLFSLGLEFSFKKLVRVGGAASITAFVEIIFITLSGYMAGRWMGWSVMDSMFLGGMLASSSTTIIIRAFDELGVKTKQFARIVYGVLVVEDIVVIFLMVLLSTIAVSAQFEGTELIMTVLKLVFFLALWFLAGIFLIPTFLKRARKLLDEETLLILSIGLCLGMVVLATQAGFSAELGAFIMGSILAETTSAEKVEHVFKPVKDLFGAVFFVSVGMMIDPNAIATNIIPVIVVTLLTLFGKAFSTTFGAVLSGQPLRQSVQVGMSMAQIGEFAFIVATLGLSLGVISNFLFPVAVGASALTTFTTPYMIKYSGRVHEWLEKILPSKWVNRLNNYASSTQNIQAESAWKQVMRAYINIAITNGIIIMALMFLSTRFLVPALGNLFGDEVTGKIVGLLLSIGVAFPFIWAFMAKKPENMAYKELWLDKEYNHGPLVVVEILRIIVGVLIIGFWVDLLFSPLVAILLGIPVVGILLLIFSQRIQGFYKRIELRFISNLNAREKDAEGKVSSTDLVQKNIAMKSALQPWSAHIVDLEVPQQAVYIGKSLFDLAWRERFGINIAYIRRGDKLIPAPGRNNKLLPFDHIGVIGTDEQLQSFMPIFEESDQVPVSSLNIGDVTLQKLVVNEYNKLKGQSIRSSGIRERTNGLVVGIERDNERILNPESTTVFEWGDVVWIVGDRRRIQQLSK